MSNTYRFWEDESLIQDSLGFQLGDTPTSEEEEARC